MLPLLGTDERPQAVRLFGEAETLVDFKPALLHADLGPAHLRVRHGRGQGSPLLVDCGGGCFNTRRALDRCFGRRAQRIQGNAPVRG